MIHISRRREHSPIGLHFDAERIAAVQLVRHGGVTSLVAAASIDRYVPGSSIGAEELDWVAAVLRRRGFRGDRVCVALPTSMAMSTVLDAPPRAAAGVVESTVCTELARAHRLASNDICPAWWDVPRPPRGRAELYAAGCAESVLDDLLDIFDASPLDVVAIDFAMLALARIAYTATTAPGRVDPVDPSEDPVSVVLEIGDRGLSMTVLCGGRIAYHRRTAEAGAAMMIDDIARELSVEPVVIRDALSGAGNCRLPHELADTVARHTAAFAEACSRHACDGFAYAGHRFRDRPIGGLWLAGPGGDHPAILDAVGTAVGLIAEPLSPRTALGTREVAASDPSLTVAAGLAMRFDR